MALPPDFDDEDVTTLNGNHVEDEEDLPGDYSTHLENILGGENDNTDQDESDDEAFVYAGDDAPDTSFAYRDQLRDALGSDHDPEEEEVHEVERSLIIHNDEEDEPLDYVPSTSVSSAGLLTPPRVDSPSFANSPSRPLARPFLHPNVSRLRSYTPGSRPVSSASIGSVGSHFFDASPSPSHFSAISRVSSPSNLHTPTSSDIFMSRPGKTKEREVFRWAQLRNITLHMYPPKATGKASSLLGPPSLGTPTVLAANGLICIGTDSGMVCVYDFKQSLKCVCGNEATGKTIGAVTALALSHDHTYVASGHSSGHIQLFDLKTPTVPARTVAPTTLAVVGSGRQEGHLRGSRIVSIGFVAGRHTALVSADEHGLAFYHSLGKVLFVEASDILRILGKYPDSQSSDNTPAASRRGRKTRYTLLAMMPLPLGVAVHPTDSYNLVALLTPTKLVVVGLKPTPKTWFKCSLDTTSAKSRLKGTLAWFPSSNNAGLANGVSSKPSPESNSPILAYAWGNTMHLIRVSEMRSKQLVRNSRTGKTNEVEVGRIRYEVAGKWVAPEDILALQWLNANQVVILGTTTLNVYDIRQSKLVEDVPFDGLSLVSSTLGATVNGSIAYADSVGDVAHSIRVYKGKIFLLGRESVQAGTLLTWADRILAFVEDGDFLSAIDLARSYYVGDAPGNSNGLPDDLQARKDVVGQKMRDLMTASSRYAFSEDRMTDDTHVTSDGRGVDRSALFEGLVASCARACIVLDDFDFLFEDLFQQYEDAGITRIFLLQLETFVLSSEIRLVPPRITQRLVALHDRDGRPDLVERVIWHIDPSCLDINQAIHLCETHHLYDALIYVHTRALRDYVAPIVALLGLIRRVQQYRKANPEPLPEGHPMESMILDAYKIYPYLANCLSGLSYPSEEPLPDEEAQQAKKDVYTFLFFGRSSMWPPGQGGTLVLTCDEEGAVEPTYPYARLLLRFDAESFLHSVDIAFEDSYLNDDKGISRLVIVRILLEIVSSGNLHPSDVSFTNIFVARNVPKYPQFLQALQPSLLHGILLRLAEDPDLETREDRQLAAEYLLSVYNPHESDRIVNLFESAGFYRILRTWYRQEHQWVPLLSTYFDDRDLLPTEVFRNVEDVLDNSSKTNNGTLPPEITATIAAALQQLLDISLTSTASLIDKYAPDLHEVALNGFGEEGDRERFVYLRHLLGPPAASEDDQHSSGPSLKPPKALRQLYVSLQCRYNPREVTQVLQYFPTDLLDWPEVIELCEKNEVYEAAVWALNHRENPREALAKADSFEKQLTLRLVEAFSSDATRPTLRNDIEALQALGQVGVDICLERSQGVSATEVPLEDIWFQLLNSQINSVQSVSACAADLPSGQNKLLDDTLSALRFLVQSTFGALVSISSTRAVSFPRLFKRLVTSATDASTGAQYTEFRTILAGMLESYRSDGDMLAISKKLVDRDLFDTIAEATRERARGWAPVGFNCVVCGKLLHGGEGVTEIIVSRTGRIYHMSSEFPFPPHPRLQWWLAGPALRVMSAQLEGSAVASDSLPASSTSSPTNEFTAASNYFVAFLIAFILFLFVFLSLGLLARRRRLRMMRDFALYGPDDANQIPQTEPEMWEPRYLDASKPRWSNVMPLSASYIRREVVEEIEKTDSEQQIPRRRWPNPLPASLLGRKLSDDRRRKTNVTEGLSLAVMIAMPQPESTEPVYDIGSLRIPWKEDV
ncbi:Lateendosome to vacuole transport-family protein [Mycena indigotica]|uniref:Lateendosome to vacuole transport-family protein n=1 Tax=Mycena indigotica TaxID=2126181 RepID=A0A8H6WI03_9AGAR|nr:Lateendosome to vacuole transport-family protein [Mycena indigotica]KAF7315618.1 Lateendosome to vacuole transport-family protein [Mycena indigotica]